MSIENQGSEFLSEGERKALARKPVGRVADLPALLISWKRLEALRIYLPQLECDSSALDAIHGVIARAREEHGYITEFLVQTPRGTVLVDTQGYKYARYAARLGVQQVQFV